MHSSYAVVHITSIYALLCSAYMARLHCVQNVMYYIGRWRGRGRETSEGDETVGVLEVKVNERTTDDKMTILLIMVCADCLWVVSFWLLLETTLGGWNWSTLCPDWAALNGLACSFELLALGLAWGWRDKKQREQGIKNKQTAEIRICDPLLFSSLLF